LDDNFGKFGGFTEKAMRILAMAAALLTVLALPAHAQMGGGKRGQRTNTNQANQKKTKVDEKAYQEALKRIPDPKDKYDPWGMTKTPDAGKKQSK
jgi:uncharacterized protein YecT (DUF1311 family)